MGTEHAKPLTRDEWKLALSIKDYLGVDLVGAQGERLGKVVDFTLKDESGKFDQVVIAVGGTLGLGGVLIAVPYDDIQHKPGTPNLVWGVDPTEFHALVNRAKKEARAKADTKVARNASGENGDKGAARLKERDTAHSTTASGGADPDVEKARAALESDHVIGKEVSKVSLEKKDGRLVIAGPGSGSGSTTHGGFDNDPATMNGVLERILGAQPGRPFTARDLRY